MNTHYDVIVCGAGIVGLSITLSLLRQGKKVALVAPNYTPYTPTSDDYHARIYAINRRSQQLFEQLGVWDMMDVKRRVAVQEMQIFGDGSGQLTFEAFTAEVNELTWIIESGQMEAALQQALKFFKVTWLDAAVQAYSRYDQKGHITTSTGQTLTADLVIGADGVNSTVRKLIGLPMRKKPYGDMGLVAQLTVEKSHADTAFQWFQNDCVLAFLPLPDTSDGHQVSMVWSLANEEAARWLEKTPEVIAEELPKHLASISRGMLGQVRVRSALKGFSLNCQEADLTVDGALLMGDAAHRLHPLAGQGLNLGLGDVVDLSRILSEKEAFRSCGDARITERYRNARTLDIMQLKMAVNGLHFLFHSQDGVLATLRNAGMSILNKSDFVKKQLIKSALS